MSQAGNWQDLATRDFDGIDPEGMVALLPVAAIERLVHHSPPLSNLRRKAALGTAGILPAKARSATKHLSVTQWRRRSAQARIAASGRRAGKMPAVPAPKMLRAFHEVRSERLTVLPLCP